MSNQDPSDAPHPELVADELLPKTPAMVYVSRRQLLKQALVKLRQTHYEEDMDRMGGGVFVCRLTVGLPPYALCHESSKKVFHGVVTTTSDDSVEQACEAALTHLEDNGLIVVKDFNHSKKRDFLRATTFCDLLQEKNVPLQKRLAAFCVFQQDLIAQVHDLCVALPPRFSVIHGSHLCPMDPAGSPGMLYVGPVPAQTDDQKVGWFLGSLYQRVKELK